MNQDHNPILLKEDFDPKENIYQFQSGDIIASIGASAGVWEIAFASQFPNLNLTFYLEDIDPNNCNIGEVNYGLKYYEKLLGKPLNGTFIPVLGTEISTNLPKNHFNKVLIINSLHEFSEQKAMLQDIHQILKKDGLLFIEELITQVSGTLHEGCQKRLFTETELITLVEKQGFIFQRIASQEGENLVFVFEVRAAL
jgi:ubiquinone/menaquinone biosynthesis C-methylase UbiE